MISRESRNSLQRREATVEDAVFLRTLFMLTKAADFSGPAWSPAERESLLGWQFEARERAYRAQFPSAQRWILVQKNESIGRLLLGLGSSAMRIVDIAVLPSKQRRGVGSQVLEEVIGDASKLGIPVRLMVELRNPARLLYERLGFHEVTCDGVHASMEWNTQAGGNDCATGGELEQCESGIRSSGTVGSPSKRPGKTQWA